MDYIRPKQALLKDKWGRYIEPNDIPQRPESFSWKEQHRWNKFQYFVLASNFTTQWDAELGVWYFGNTHIAFNKGVVSVQHSESRFEADGVIRLTDYLEEKDFKAVCAALGCEARGKTSVLKTALTATEVKEKLKPILKKYNS